MSKETTLHLFCEKRVARKSAFAKRVVENNTQVRGNSIFMTFRFQDE